MEIINESPKPRPILGVCFPQIFLPTRRIQPLKPQDQTSLALLKYFPKHIDSLPSNLSNLKTRIKRLKLIKRIPSDHSNNILRVLLANKRKNIKFASGAEDRECKGGYNKHNLDLLKMLPNLQKVEFCMEAQDFQDAYHKNKQKKQCYWINKMSNYLNKMTNLKHLKLSNRSYYLLPLLSKLNSFDSMLGRLEVFRLNFILFYPGDFPDFQALLEYKSVLKYLTHLQLNLPEDEDFFEVFQLFPDRCSRLLSLSYSIYQRELSSNFEDICYLQCLQSFQNLQKLSLYCGPKLDTFRHCKFPTSLRFLDLYLDDVEWQSLVTNKAFFNKQEGLENLEKLKISLQLYDPTEEKDIVRDFIEDLLSRILSLKEFDFEFYPQLQIYEGTPSYPFDLSRFLNCFQHLSHSLQRLAINDSHSRYNFTNLDNAQAFHFPELSCLSIQGRSFTSLSLLENITKLVHAKPDAPVPCIKLEKIKIDSCKALLELFNSLKRTSGKQIELVVFYYSTVEDDEYFKENYEQVKKDSRNLRNVNLEIKFSIAWPRFRWVKELKSLKECFGNFIIIERIPF